MDFDGFPNTNSDEFVRLTEYFLPLQLRQILQIWQILTDYNPQSNPSIYLAKKRVKYLGMGREGGKFIISISGLICESFKNFS